MTERNHYTEGATNRMNGMSKDQSDEKLRGPYEWRQANENRRGWDDMNTFITMAEIVGRKKKA